MNKKIVIATGGTGGHIFPSLSLFEFLEKKYEINLTTDKRGAKFLKNIQNKRIKIIYSSPISKGNIFKLVLDLFKIAISFFYSLAFLIKFRPKIVIGMGGYSSFPVCIAAYFLRVPLLLYENNLVIGKTNKFLLPFAKKIIVSNNKIKGINIKFKNKVFFSGYLLRKKIFEIKTRNLEVDKKQLSILIIGGSQSAKIFSETLPIVIGECNKIGIKFKILQQCLENQKDELKEIYTKLHLDFELFHFSENLSKYYQETDLAITRSGASSIAELINLNIPFVAIPLPFSADNHQFENASYFEKKGYCFLLEEKFINDKLFKILKDLDQNREKLIAAKNKMREHSDKDVVLKINILIEKILNV